MPLTAEQIDQLRMPNPYQVPAPTGVNNPFMSMMGGGPMSRNKGQPQGYNPDPRGMVDPAALQALAFGTEYDVEARRNAIAARILENERRHRRRRHRLGGAEGLRAARSCACRLPATARKRACRSA